MQETIWTNFSMTPVSPTVGKNPVTRTLNMVPRSGGVWAKRFGFSPTAFTPGLTVSNHIVADVNGTTYLVFKQGASINYTDGVSIGTIVAPANDPPLGGAVAAASERGSFAVFNGEVYYCDSNTIFAWDGTSSACRRPGVVSLDGQEYNEPPWNFGQIAGEATPTPTSAWYDPGVVTGVNWSDTGHDPYVKVGSPTQFIGEKVLNQGFCFSYYDPVRRTYGRRSEVFALPYIWGPADPGNPGNATNILTDAVAQYAKFIKTPPVPAGHAEYLIAVWSTLGQRIIVGISRVTINPGLGLWSGNYAPNMHKRMSEALFLEGYFNPSQTNVRITKGNETLVRSGAYIDTFARPVPARFMSILSNGTAVYFYPWRSETSGPANLGKYAEFSFRHPEQIARASETQRDTVSMLPTLRGTPLAIINDDRYQLLVTNLELYQIGFDGQVVLRPLSGGLGARSTRAITAFSEGLVWYTDAGVAWLRGGSVILLDKKFLFGDWFDPLPISNRKTVVTGVCEATGEIMVWARDLTSSPLQFPPIHTSGHRAMVYNFAIGGMSEFKMAGNGIPEYQAWFPADSGGQTWTWLGGDVLKYPSTTYTDATGNYEAMVECWINDLPETMKQLGSVVVDFGTYTGTATIECAAFRSANPLESQEVPQSRSHQVANTLGQNRRFRSPEFNGMRGHYIRLRVRSATNTGEFSLSRVGVEWMPDEDGDARSY